MQRALTVTAACLALIVIVAGAYVRLSDAGLGCPDWPGCYGKATPSHALESIERAVEMQGGEHGAVSFAKAWKEMGHRYLAGLLGLLVAAIAALSWSPGSGAKAGRGLSVALLAVLAFQAALGMWTVTLLLKPAIVTAHLIGGLTTLALLIWLALSRWQFVRAQEGRSARVAAVIGLAAVAIQILLGGWVSANYAALACTDYPLCQGQVMPRMDFADAFHVIRNLGKTAAGDLLSFEALTAIHWMHRTFALIATAVLAWVVWRAMAIQALRGIAVWVGILLVIQISLGIWNVLGGLPLSVAVAHNLGATLLLSALVVLNFFAFHGLAPQRERASPALNSQPSRSQP